MSRRVAAALDRAAMFTAVAREWLLNRLSPPADPVVRGVRSLVTDEGAGVGPAAVSPSDQPAAGRPTSELLGAAACALAEAAGGVDLADTGLVRELFDRAQELTATTPPAPFTFGDLMEAEAIIAFYADEFAMKGSAEHKRLKALATRLGDAGDADPNP